ncbi:MAG: aspartate kinase [Gemmatimonadales bacterium]|nr:MAG: aspartate kinase [Gemmatimonadales bacterium]
MAAGAVPGPGLHMSAKVICSNDLELRRTAIMTDGNATGTDAAEFPSGDPGTSLLHPGVSKFGGTSLATGQRMLHAARLVASQVDGSGVVVVSAMSGVTNRLEELARVDDPDVRREILDELGRVHLEGGRQIMGDAFRGSDLSKALERRLQTLEDVPTDLPLPRRRDRIVSAGEDLSALLVTRALIEVGLPAIHIDARRVVRTDERFGQAIPDDDETLRLARSLLLPLLKEGRVPVLQGFLGATDSGETTTLGRGGSDFTAAILGAALGAREVTIWTDVDGIFTADPRLVPEARVLEEMGYEEAVELAWFGARVIHPAAAKHAVGRRVSLRVRNSLRPEAPGTLIRTDRRGSAGVAALAFRPRVSLITVRSRPLFMAWGFLARVFDVLARSEIAVDLVATSHTSTAFTVADGAPLDRVRRELETFSEVEVETGLGTVTAVGAGLRSRPGLAARLLMALDDIPVRLVSQATDAALSLVLESGDGAEVLKRLHRELGTTDTPSPH